MTCRLSIIRLRPSTNHLCGFRLKLFSLFRFSNSWNKILTLDHSFSCKSVDLQALDRRSSDSAYTLNDPLLNVTQVSRSIVGFPFLVTYTVDSSIGYHLELCAQWQLSLASYRMSLSCCINSWLIWCSMKWCIFVDQSQRVCGLNSAEHSTPKHWDPAHWRDRQELCQLKKVNQHTAVCTWAFQLTWRLSTEQTSASNAEYITAKRTHRCRDSDWLFT